MIYKILPHVSSFIFAIHPWRISPYLIVLQILKTNLFYTSRIPLKGTAFIHRISTKNFANIFFKPVIMCSPGVKCLLIVSDCQTFAHIGLIHNAIPNSSLIFSAFLFTLRIFWYEF